MDPPCLHISDFQLCSSTLCGSLRRKVTPLICYSAIRLETEPWTTRPPGPFQPCPAEQQLDTGVGWWEAEGKGPVGAGGGEKPVKNAEICPLNNQRSNQFVQRPRVVGRLQKNVWSGRSLGVRISEKHTAARKPAWVRGVMAKRRGTNTNA